MKKVLLSLVAVVMALVLIPNVYAETEQELPASPVPVYMFTKDGCSACESALIYFKGLNKENPGLFDLVVLEAFNSKWKWNSEGLKDLLLATYENFEENTEEIATPTIVIGSYHTIGLPQDTSIVKKAIEDVRDGKDKEDVIQKLAEKLKVNTNEERKYIDLNTTDEEKIESGKYDALIIVGIFVVLIGGFAGLIIVSKK